ncbi:hypothetical protein AC579_5548 [Pseudocercospora musae]|uniref:Uncharacterized protein n=1 Tax=Pseudocercospora musae TaxID=113226 RepID=A0A139I958_9PEZI|nr:hypothetical protein AC579_5548 [Pseudocercospora musae]
MCKMTHGPLPISAAFLLCHSHDPNSTSEDKLQKISHQTQHKQSSSCPPSAATKVFSTFELLEPILLCASAPESCKSMQLLLSAQQVCKSAYDTIKISKPLQQRLWSSLPGLRGAVNPLFANSSNKAPFLITGGVFSDAKSVTVHLANISKAEGRESWRNMVVLSDVEVYSVWMRGGGRMVMFHPKFGKASMTGEELLMECERLGLPVTQ